MNSPTPPSRALQGAARLAVEATLGVTDLVEAVHARAATLPGLRADARTRGVTGLVYRSVRGVTRAVGEGLERALGLLGPALQQLGGTPRQAEREALLAALNGVLGDHLAATDNPLALTMQLRQAGQPVRIGDGSRPDRPGALLLLHGLCMNDRQWQRKSQDLGALLSQPLGLTPLQLRYNSGLPIHRNGAELATLLEQLVSDWPGGLQRLVLLGHSMGGLIARSALHQARAQGLSWPQRVSELICLGSPHAGAPLERIGQQIDRLLEATPYAAPFARLGQLRSAGINDLHDGKVLEDGAPTPLPPGLRSLAVAGQLAGKLKAKALGDGLVTVASALGEHAQPGRQLDFSERLRLEGVSHLDLLSDPAVAAGLQQWLGCAA
ncbi:MAG: esterase/lipase family protein [Inhella sp.]